MKVVYVCSPYRGTPEEIKRNFDYAVELTKEALMAGYYPITPHLYITACLDDTKPETYAWNRRSVGVAGKV